MHAKPLPNKRGKHKLTDWQVYAMRHRVRLSAHPRRECNVIARETGLSRSAIRNAVKGVSYAHVAEPVTEAALGAALRLRPPALTDQQVLALRRRYAGAQGSLSLRTLQEELAISRRALSRMLSGETYAHVPEPCAVIPAARQRRRWTDEQVLFMRLTYPLPRVCLSVLSERYGGDVDSIANALVGRSYKNVPGALDKLKPAGMAHRGLGLVERRKLSDQDVEEMRRSYNPRTMNASMLGRKHGLHIKTVQNILLGITYKNVPGILDSLGPTWKKVNLTNEQVIKARHDVRTGRASVADIERRHGFSNGSAFDMLRGRTYQHVPLPVTEAAGVLRKRYRAMQQKIASRPRPLIKVPAVRLPDHDETVDLVALKKAA